VRTDRGRPLPFERSVTLVEFILFSSRSTLVQARFSPENFLNKRYELQFFFWHKTLISAQSSLLIFLILNKTITKFVTYYGYCHSLDGATLFSKVDSNKLRGNVKNEITLICAQFGAHLIDRNLLLKLQEI